MDFGIDKLIEMLEERFGRRASTLLLALIGLGAAAVAIHAVVEFFVLPVIAVAVSSLAYISGMHLTLPDNQIDTIFLVAEPSLLVILAVTAFMGYRSFRKTVSSNAELMRSYNEANEAQARFRKALKEAGKSKS